MSRVAEAIVSTDDDTAARQGLRLSSFAAEGFSRGRPGLGIQDAGHPADDQRS